MARTRQTIAPTAEPIHLDEAKLHLRVDDTADDTVITRLIRAARMHCEAFLGQQMVAATYTYQFEQFPDVVTVPYPPLLEVTGITYVDSDSVTQTVDTDDYVVDTNPPFGRIYEAYNESWPTCREFTNDITVTFVAGKVIPFTVNATTDYLTWSGWTPTDADSYQLSNSGGATGALPAGLSTYTRYFVRDTTGSTCKLAATSGGTAIDITGAGTGTHFIGEVPENWRAAMLLLIGHWYENREAVVVGSTTAELPQAAKALLWDDRLFWPER